MQQERGVKPRRWITGIDLLRESKFRFRVALVTRVAEGFAEVTAQQRTLWLSGGGNVKIEAALLSVAEANAAEAASEPGIAQTAVEPDGFIKERDGGADFISCAEKKSFQRDGLGVARRKSEASVESFRGGADPAAAKFELRDACPREGEAWRFLCGKAGGEQRVFEPERGLLGVGLGEEFRRKFGRQLIGGLRQRSLGVAARDCINDKAKSVREVVQDGVGGGAAVEGIQHGRGLRRLAHGDEQGGGVNLFVV